MLRCGFELPTTFKAFTAYVAKQSQLAEFQIGPFGGMQRERGREGEQLKNSCRRRAAM
jgi:hypothetical protein